MDAHSTGDDDTRRVVRMVLLDKPLQPLRFLILLGCYSLHDYTVTLCR